MDPICTTMFIPDSIKNYISLWDNLLVNQLDTCCNNFLSSYGLKTHFKLCLVSLFLSIEFQSRKEREGGGGGGEVFIRIPFPMGLSVHILVTNARHCGE